MSALGRNPRPRPPSTRPFGRRCAYRLRPRTYGANTLHMATARPPLAGAAPQPGLSRQAEQHLRCAGYAPSISAFRSWQEMSAQRRRPAAQAADLQLTIRGSVKRPPPLLLKPLGVARGVPPPAAEATPPLLRAQRALRRLSETGANCDITLSRAGSLVRDHGFHASQDGSRDLDDCLALLDGVSAQHPSRPPTPSSTVSYSDDDDFEDDRAGQEFADTCQEMLA